MKWIPEVQCSVECIEYRYDIFTGEIVVGPDSAPDMCGCIAMFKRIDPAIHTVIVRQYRKDGNHKLDGLYLKYQKEWLYREVFEEITA